MTKAGWIRAVAGSGAMMAAVGIAVTLAAAPRAAAMGQGGPGARQDSVTPRLGARLGRRMLMGRVASRLGLTDAQKTQLRTIAQSHRDEWRALADRLVAARTALREATTAATIDEGAIRQRTADVAAVQADAAVARARGRAEMLQVLTPEQQAQAAAIRTRARDRIIRRRGR